MTIVCRRQIGIAEFSSSPIDVTHPARRFQRARPFRVWFILGCAVFAGVIAIFALMISKPLLDPAQPATGTNSNTRPYFAAAPMSP
jgi:uncharacterized membrane protein